MDADSMTQELDKLKKKMKFKKTKSKAVKKNLKDERKEHNATKEALENLKQEKLKMEQETAELQTLVKAADQTKGEVKKLSTELTVSFQC